MKIIFLSIIFFLISVIVFSQQSVNADSLEQSILTEKDDSLKIEALFTLTRFYTRPDPDKSVEFANKGIQLASQMNYYKAIAMFYNQRGLALRSKGDYDNALNDLLQAAEINMKLGKDSEIDLAANYGNIGGIYQKKSLLANNTSFSDKAIEYYRMAAEIFTKLDNKNGIAGCHLEMGIIFHDRKKYKESIAEYKKAMVIVDEMNFIPGRAMILNNMGNSYTEMGELDTALNLFKESFEIQKQMGDSIAMASLMINMATVYERKGEWNKVISFAAPALKIVFQKNIFDDIKSASGCLATAYKNLGDYKNALFYYEQKAQYKDSLLSEDSNRQMEELEGKFQNEKKTLEIDNLNKENELKEIESQRSKESLAMQEKITASVIIGGVVSLMLLIIALRAYLQKRKANVLIAQQKSEVEMQKEIVEEKNKEITDSINYAKRIQAAILPPNKLLKECLPDSFILYKPKDIVAGDFYWLEKKDDAVLFAAADCTGHGVPGALVSVICNNGLNRSVREHNISEPGKILDKTRHIIISEFEKSDDEVKDGMDIALCSLSVSKLTLDFAGANNPLWIIRPNDGKSIPLSFGESLSRTCFGRPGVRPGGHPEFIEIKPDKQPIGKFAGAKDFSTHTVDLKKGDAIYIFTDGYQDQFGGEKGKKFKSSQLKELLISICHKTMNDQKIILDEAFETWRSSLEQIDDVCIIGVRI